MPITQTLVVFNWSELGGGIPPTGTDTLELSAEISDGISSLRPPAITPKAELSFLGQSALIVPANDDATTVPQGTYYKHVGRIGTGKVRELKAVTSLGQSTVISGAGGPSGGADGNWYVNTTTGTAFGPKVSGTWPAFGIPIGNWDNTVPVGQVYWAALPIIDPSFFDSGGGGDGGGSFSVEQLVRNNSLNQLKPPTAGLPINGQRLLNVGAPAAATDGAQALGSLIGSTYYEASLSLYTIATATGAPVDTTNLTISFTAISTAALIVLQAPVAYSSGAGRIGWTLYTHGTLTQMGYWVTAFNEATADGAMGTAVIRVTGLTAGASYHWDWGWGCTSGTALMAAGCSQGAAVGSTNVGPMVMRAFAA